MQGDKYVVMRIISALDDGFKLANLSLESLCFEKAGEYFHLLCPLTGEAKEGKNWMETH